MTTYVTEYRIGPLTYGDYVEAPDWDEAQRLCTARRPNEIVTGELVDQFEVDEDVMIWLGANQN
jgi:hypothetical protein